jgi:excisionase family DNA binding protein
MNPMQQSYPEVMQVSDIQQILGIGRRQAYELANSGQFHVVRVGKSIRIHREVFLTWLNG